METGTTEIQPARFCIYEYHQPYRIDSFMVAELEKSTIRTTTVYVYFLLN